MEQHPIPQNVTTFQFRLIGDMTIKQFGYLAAGAILAYISYKLPLPFFFTWPLTVVFALGGIGFAFVPIEDRPMDVWVLSFFKNIYSPTQFLWQKTQPPKMPAPPPSPAIPVAAVSAPSPVTPGSTAAPLPPKVAARPVITKPINATIAQPVTPSAPQPLTPPEKPYAPPVGQSPKPSSIATQLPKAGMFDWFFQMFAPKKISPPAGGPTSPSLLSHTPIVMSASYQPREEPRIPIPTAQATPARYQPEPKVSHNPFFGAHPSTPKPAESKPAHQDTHKTNALEKQLADLQKQLSDQTLSQQRILDLQKQLVMLAEDRSKLQAEIQALKKRPNLSSVIPAPEPQKLKPAAMREALPRLTTFPNVVAGIVKDSDGTLLPGVLVTIRDKEDMPLRALKTNKIGQFASSTPLPNGTYVLDIEDPRGRYTFVRQTVTLSGALVPTIEMTAKSAKDLNREKLSKELFGTAV